MKSSFQFSVFSFQARSAMLRTLGFSMLLTACTFAFSSCRGPDPSGNYPTGSQEARPLTLPPQAYTGAPGPGAAYPPYCPPVAPSAAPLPYQPTGPWAPPGIAQPWPPDEYLADGGDRNAPAGVLKNGKVVGVGPEDTIAYYDTVDGRTLVQPSNRVHVYSPRFMAVRQVIGLQQNDQMERTVGVYRPEQLALQERNQLTGNAKQNIQTEREAGRSSLTTFRTRQGDSAVSQALGPKGFQDCFKLFEDLAVIRTGTQEQAQLAWLARGTTAAVAWEKKQAVQVFFGGQLANALVGNQQVETVHTYTQPPYHPKLRVVKVASTPYALPGETVDFTIRFDNVGDQVIGNVTLVDNLTTRLEYVPGTAQSSLKANFSTQPSESESLVLRWEIIDPVKPARGGVVRFTCRVR